MKKLLTIVLALVMVFAIAAPAFAIGGSPIAAAAASDFDAQYDVNVVFYQGQVTATNIGTAVPKADMAAKNQEITTAVVITRKSAPNPVVTIGNYDLVLTYSGYNASPALAKASFTYDDLTDTWAVGAVAAGTTTTVKGVTTDTFANATIDAALQAADAVGDKLVLTVYGTASGDIKVEAFFGTKFVPAAATATVNGKYTVLSSAQAANIAAQSFTVAQVAPGTLEVTFTTGANGIVTTISDGTDSYSKGDYYDATAAEWKTGWHNAANAGATAEVAAFLDGVFADFNFDYAKRNTTALAHSDFLPYLAIPSTTKTATLKLFTAALTVSDTTTVPNTGDNAAVIGFVMIALAIVAAAAVAVKKVRA